MICPHCNKEADGYFGVQTSETSVTATGFCPAVVTSNRTENEVFNPTYTLNNGCAGGVLTTWITNVNVNAAAGNPVVANPNALTVAGCANQSLNIHYHTF